MLETKRAAPSVGAASVAVGQRHYIVSVAGESRLLVGVTNSRPAVPRFCAGTNGG